MGPLLELPEGEETYDVLGGPGLCGYIDANERGLLVPPRTGDDGVFVLEKYSLIGLLELFWASLISGNCAPPLLPPLPALPGPPRSPPPPPPPGVPIKLGPPEAFVFRFLFRSVGVLGVATGFSGLGSKPPCPSPE